MDMQSQMRRPYDHDQAEDPIRIHHPEEEEHHEKGTTKVLKKVKEKAKKIKNSLTKHGHGHEHDQDVDEEDDEYDEPDPEVHGAPVYESSAVRGGVTGHPESLTNVPAPDEIIPPGTNVFPVVSSDYTRPIEPEPLREREATSHPARVTDMYESDERREAPSHPIRAFDMSEREESREAHQMPMNTPVSLLSTTEDVTKTFAPGEDEGFHEGFHGQRKVNIERPKGLEEDPAAPGGGSGSLSGVSNYQSKVTDPTHEGGSGETGIPGIVESLGRMKVKDESPDQKSGGGFERDLPTRSHEVDQKNNSGIEKNSPTVLTSGSIASLGEEFPARSDDTGLGRDLPTGTHDQFSPELSRPKERDDLDLKAEEIHESKPSTYAAKIGSATSFVTDKAIAAKNAVASKLGYSGESGGGGGQHQEHQSPVGDESTPRSAQGYGQKVAGTVAEKLTPVYEKVKETGSTVMSKLPLSGGGKGAEEKQQVETKLPLSGGGSEAEEKQKVEGKGVSTRDYLAEKLRPGEEDKALSEMIAEKLHLGGGEKKTTTTKEVQVTVEKIPSDQILEEREHGDVIVAEGGGGMVGKVKGAVTSWLGGTKEETKPKSSHSLDESSQSLGSTVGTMGFSDSGGPLSEQRGLQDSGN